MSTADHLRGRSAVDELKRAWHAVTVRRLPHRHRTRGAARGRGPRPRDRRGSRQPASTPSRSSAAPARSAPAPSPWPPASPPPVRSGSSSAARSTASGLAAASTAELGLHPTDWRQGKRDHVLLERPARCWPTSTRCPCRPRPRHETQLTILDVGWEAGQLLATDCWLADGRPRPPTRSSWSPPATIPGMRRLGVALDLLSTHWQPEQIAVAVRRPAPQEVAPRTRARRRPAVRRALDADRCVEIPEDRELAVNGLDSRPIPAPPDLGSPPAARARPPLADDTTA